MGAFVGGRWISDNQDINGLALSDLPPSLGDYVNPNSGFGFNDAMKGFGQVGQGLAGLAAFKNANANIELGKQKVALAGADFEAKRKIAEANSLAANSLAGQLKGNTAGSSSLARYQQNNALNLPTSPV